MFLNNLFTLFLDYAEKFLGLSWIGDFQKMVVFIDFGQKNFKILIGLCPICHDCICVSPLCLFELVFMHIFICSCIVHMCSVVCIPSVWQNTQVAFLSWFGLKWFPLFRFTLDWTCLTCFDPWVCVLHTLPNCASPFLAMHHLGTHHAHHMHTRCTHTCTIAIVLHFGNIHMV